MSTDRKVTLMYRSESKGGTVTITSDQAHARRSGDITRIYRSKRDAVPKLVICTVPKGTAPWEISSELEPLMLQSGSRAEYQLTELAEAGAMLLDAYARGMLWNSQIVVVPASFVPKQEKAFDAGTGAETSES